MTSSTNPTEEAVEAAARVLADRAGGWSPPGWWHERTARESLAAAFPALRAQIETELRQQIESLHHPEQFTKRVPVFDEFDSPVQHGTECRTCRNGYWPCKTAALLLGGQS